MKRRWVRSTHRSQDVYDPGMPAFKKVMFVTRGNGMRDEPEENLQHVLWKLYEYPLHHVKPLIARGFLPLQTAF